MTHAHETVLVIGANGFIGEAVAVAYRRQGHHVYGLVRSAEAAKRLVAEEIVPILCSQEETAKWLPTAEKCTVIIDAIGYNERSAGTLKAAVEAGEKRLKAGATKPLFVFTSGIMVYGKAGLGRAEPLTEAVLAEPFDFHWSGGARLKYENEVRASTAALVPTVVRPGWVYGGSGGTYIPLFFARIDVAAKKITVSGRADKRYSWIHVDDMGEAYMLLAKTPRDKVAGQLFNFVSGETPSLEEILHAAAKAAGLDLSQVEYIQKSIEESDTMGRNIETDVKIAPKNVTEILGWTPKHAGFLQEMSIYYEAWRVAGLKTFGVH